MAYLYYNTLGNTGNHDTNGNLTCGNAVPCVTLSGPFTNIQSNYYWSASKSAPGSSGAPWEFDMGIGRQNSYLPTAASAWAVHTGDVSVVPAPASIYLLGAGLIGLVCLSRRRSKGLQA